jgi:hypothetical protein
MIELNVFLRLQLKQKRMKAANDMTNANGKMTYKTNGQAELDPTIELTEDIDSVQTAVNITTIRGELLFAVVEGNEEE